MDESTGRSGQRLANARITGLLTFAAFLGSCSVTPPVSTSTPLPPHAKYVAMGSSFAAGPGITTPDSSAPRCGRSADNYAHQLARSLQLEITDVSCGGATTAHILGPWNELPPQMEALTADTRLVTITIGGNDVGYIGGLIAASCKQVGGPPPGSPFRGCPQVPIASETEWRALADSLRNIVNGIRERAPAARIILVDYITVLPPRGTCDAVPLTAEQSDEGRRVATRLAGLTERFARQEDVELLRASDLSKGHDACSSQPWATGFPGAGASMTGAPYHPNLAGMTAIAKALQQLLMHSR